MGKARGPGSKAYERNKNDKKRGGGGRGGKQFRNEEDIGTCAAVQSRRGVLAVF